MESLDLLEPYGNGNSSPIFYTVVQQAWPPKIVGRNHLKFYFEQEGRVLEGVGFGMSRYKNVLRKKGLNIRIAFIPQLNEFLNKISIQLVIKEFTILD